MQQQLEEQEESTAGVQETFASLNQEVEEKTRKLRKVWHFKLNTLKLK